MLVATSGRSEVGCVLSRKREMLRRQPIELHDWLGDVNNNRSSPRPCALAFMFRLPANFSTTSVKSLVLVRAEI